MDVSSNKRNSGQRPKKRKFSGNRYTASNSNSSNQSSSFKKLKSSCFQNIEVTNDFLGYRIFDINILFTEISKYLCCKICGKNIRLQEILTHGLSSKFSIFCDNCNELSSFRNSSMLGEKQNASEINIRFLYAMRCVGQGLAGMNTFCSVMDLPPPVHKNAYNKSLRTICSAVSETANLSMAEAARQELKIAGQSDITVSGDGSWKTRGHASQIGITSVIGAETGKVLDIEVMSSFCKGCSLWKKPKTGNEYEMWKKSHDDTCVKNHSGSAGKMEVCGMLRIFQRSEAKHNARYVNYIGDGDTKTFLELQKHHIYGPSVELKKIECVGHVQKRMGTRLRQLKHNMRGQKLEDGKSLSGKGRLTDKLIDQITVYYGNAIRNNKNSCMDMRKAVWAIYYHKRSTDNEPLHDFCPQGENSWCAYQKAKSMGTVAHFCHKNVLPTSVMDCIKNVFKDLSDPALLTRCLGGRTQNPNESFNSVVWKLCPKTSGCSRIVAEIATNEAVVLFNEGRKGRLQIMNSLGFRVGHYALNNAIKIDKKRLEEAEKSATVLHLEIKRMKHMVKTSKLEAQKEGEGVMYEAGNF